VKLIRASEAGFDFQFSEREKQLFLEVLRLYPRVPSAHPKISKAGLLPDQATTQRLLDEALAEQRGENKRHLQALMSEAQRWIKEQDRWILHLSGGGIDWLLQVLNDIRVGSWVMLGSPEHWNEEITPRTAPHLWAMELAGAFQMAFLHATEEGQGTATE
jgi:hypothetical protein